MFTGFLTCTVKAASEIHRQKQIIRITLFLLLLYLFTKNMLLPQQTIIHLATDIPVNFFCDRSVPSVTFVKNAKTHAIPLWNHVTQQKLTETTENRSALTKTPNFGIFRFIPVYSGTILVHFVSFRCYSASFRHIPVYSSIFRFVLFLCLVTPTTNLAFQISPHWRSRQNTGKVSTSLCGRRLQEKEKEKGEWRENKEGMRERTP